MGGIGPEIRQDWHSAQGYLEEEFVSPPIQGEPAALSDCGLENVSELLLAHSTQAIESGAV